MWILLILACIAIPYMGLRYSLIKLQGLINAQETSDEIKESVAAIILGKTEFSQQVGKLLEEEGIEVLLMEEPDMQDRKKTYQYLFALSHNDVDNVLMCRIGEKIYHIKAFISICNQRDNERIYESGGIPYCSREGISARMLVQTVLHKRETEICQKN